VPASVTKQRLGNQTKNADKADNKLADLKIRKFTVDMAKIMGFSQWYEDNLEDEFRLRGPNEATCILYLRAYVDEGMYKTLQGTMKEGIANLNVWLDRLSSLYPDKEFVSTYVKQLGETTQKKEELVSMYLTRLGGVWNKAHPRRAPIRDHEFVEVFVKGLDGKLRKEVGKYGDHKELTRALKRARETEKSLWTVRSLEDVAKGGKPDRSSVVCKFFAAGNCTKGAACPYKHGKAKVAKAGAGGAAKSGAAQPPGLPPPPPGQVWMPQGPMPPPWGGHINMIRAPGAYWCTLRECMGKPPHQYVDCRAGSRECRKCGKKGHHQARCPEERCEKCLKKGIATWFCCGRRRDGEEIGRGIRETRREAHVEEEEEADREMGTGEHGERTRSSGRGGR
jgi:hypothetical protein